jgi:hypothetical protein
MATLRKRFVGLLLWTLALGVGALGQIRAKNAETPAPAAAADPVADASP